MADSQSGKHFYLNTLLITVFIETKKQVLLLFLQICRGVQFMHRKKFIHKDLKPQNIMLKSSVVSAVPLIAKIGDLGTTK